jgi:SLOG cluster2/TIR domain
MDTCPNENSEVHQSATPTTMNTPPPALSPVRIYLLWHPKFAAGLALARWIYNWFRLETMEGIPVFFRSNSAPDSKTPLPIPHDCKVNYIIPFVEAHMVACPHWRAYVAGFVATGLNPRNSDRLFPVAMDSVAYQMPSAMRKLNYIRHNLTQSPPPEMEGLLSQLTEVLCRDLRSLLHQDGTSTDLKSSEATSWARRAGKLKIFLSHAKADGTCAPVALKEYIQGQTQCEAFFDETDIASGYDYSEVLEEAIREDSAGLLVVQGDYYADRPWCRKEIRDFLKPVRELAPDVPSPGGGAHSAPAFFIPPVVVVYNMEGKKIGRTIPELGHAPCLRWQPKIERLVVTTLLREILLGLFYRFMARQIAAESIPKTAVAPSQPPFVVINRTPDPVMVDRILDALKSENETVHTIIHPGYGLSKMEKDGLTMVFPDFRFHSFSEPRSLLPAAQPAADLAGYVLSVSVGNAQDILQGGFGDEHNKELLTRLLRPLFRRQVSLLYSGAMPTDQRDVNPWENPLNFTGVFLDLLLSERSAAVTNFPPSRLYNLNAWPKCSVVTESLIAQWTDICSFVSFTQERAGIDSSLWQAQVDPDKPTPQQLANQARCLTAMRKQACAEITCTLPDKPPQGEQEFTFRTFAHLFLGGKTAYAAGIIPGVLEEILYALDAQKPIFIIGAGRGAAGLVARWLVNPPPTRPLELTIDHYLKEPNFHLLYEELGKLPAGTTETADTALDRLWDHVRSAHDLIRLPALLNNGLDEGANLKLFTSENFGEICELFWNGIDALLTDS